MKIKKVVQPKYSKGQSITFIIRKVQYKRKVRRIRLVGRRGYFYEVSFGTGKWIMVPEYKIIKGE